MQYIENRTFDEIKTGDSADLTRTLKLEDIELFAVMSGDVNPTHVDENYASSDMFHKIIAHGMWGGALISAVLGTELPGPGTIYRNQSLSFCRAVGLGDTVTIRVTVTDKDAAQNLVTLACLCTNQNGETVIEGTAVVVAPNEKVRRPRVALPEVHLHERAARFNELIAATKPLPPVRTAVVHPCDGVSLEGALEAAAQDMIVPVLIGPKAKIEALVPGPGRFWPKALGDAPVPQLIISPRAPKGPFTSEIPVDPTLLDAGDHNGSTFYQHQKFNAAVRGQGVVEVTLEDGKRAGVWIL